MATAATNRGQYKLHAYVCGNACLRRIDNMGTVTFTKIFTERPDGCRYAVVSHWNVVDHADEVLVWDLYETREKLRTGRLIEPEPVYRGDCVDAAVMATFMTYKDG